MDLDRRTSIRHPAVPNRTRVEWWEGEGFHQSTAALLDISVGGALLVADGLPPLRQPVWLRVEEPAETDEVRVSVVRHAESGRVGLSFPGGCPPDLFLAATLGVNPCRVFDGHNPWESA